MTTQFFIPMRPPTTTHNAKELHAYMKGGKPCAVLHDSSELKAARAKLHAYLAPHAPEKVYHPLILVYQHLHLNKFVYLYLLLLLH